MNVYSIVRAMIPVHDTAIRLTVRRLLLFVGSNVRTSDWTQTSSFLTSVLSFSFSTACFYILLVSIPKTLPVSLLFTHCLFE